MNSESKSTKRTTFNNNKNNNNNTIIQAGCRESGIREVEEAESAVERRRGSGIREVEEAEDAEQLIYENEMYE